MKEKNKKGINKIMENLAGSSRSKTEKVLYTDNAVNLDKKKLNEINTTKPVSFTNDDNISKPSDSMLSLKPKVGCSLADVNVEYKPTELISGMFPIGQISALIGDAGVGKSWAVIAAALTITAGKEFLPTENYEVRRNGRAFLIETEARISVYMERILALDGKLENFIVPNKDLRILSYSSNKDRELIESIIQEDKPELMIIDSLAGFSDADENSSSIMPCIKWLTNLAQVNNLAVVFTQLVNKSEMKDGRLTANSTRGFSGINQYPTMIWGIVNPDRSDTKKKQLYQVKNNISQLDSTDYIFTLDNSTINFTGEVIENRKTKIARRQETFLANQSKSDKEIVEMLQQFEPDTKFETLKRWVERERPKKQQ